MRNTQTLFLNLGHTIDHLMLLIFPTVVIAMAPEFGRGYGEMLALSLGGFIAFGAGSLPAGWLADHWSRRGMMAIFFLGIGTAAIITGLARTPLEIAAALTLVGLFGAIYHPVGIAMLVKGQTNVGHVLGVNGVYGNLGIAFAALTAGALAHAFGWRTAFIVPGILTLFIGLGFVALVKDEGKGAAGSGRKIAVDVERAVLIRAFAVMLIATVCGGVIFNATTVAMPKVFDERLKALTDTTLGIGIIVAVVYAFAAMAQLIVGFFIDRRPIRHVFIPVVALQVPLLFLAGSVDNYVLIAVAFGMMFFVFGQIPINDAMIATYTNEAWRARVYAVKYVISFTVSAGSVQLVAWIHKSTGDFQRLFLVLTIVGAISASAALFYPGPKRVVAA
jgi:MFS family permease